MVEILTGFKAVQYLMLEADNLELTHIVNLVLDILEVYGDEFNAALVYFLSRELDIEII